MKRKLIFIILISILTLTGCGKTTANEETLSGGDTASAAYTEIEETQIRQEQPAQIENDNTAYPPCVMVDGTVYQDTGYVSFMIGCGNMDGEITSTVDGTELPTENNQSNFGTGYQYQGASANQIRVEIDGVKRIFRDINSTDITMPMEVMNFNAEVKEITENGELLVTHISTAEGFNEMSGGDYYVPRDNLRDEVKVGDIITIWFSGMVMETYPAQLGEVYRIEKAAIAEVNWESYFDGINGSAVIFTPSENSYQIYNQEMALTQRSPCSTFKIISSLIALENHVMIPDESARTWSGEIFWNENWNRDINFEDAFRNSCVWYYREMIDEIGKDTMQKELNELQYGNCDISDWEGYLNTNNNNRALTGFWIESSLKISPKEQVEVLDRIFGEHSVYSQETQNNLKQVMLLPDQQNGDMLVYGKTGLGKSHGVVVDAWFTGFADTSNGRRYFCIYLGETDAKEVSSTKAKEIAIEILADLDGVQ